MLLFALAATNYLRAPYRRHDETAPLKNRHYLIRHTKLARPSALGTYADLSANWRCQQSLVWI